MARKKASSHVVIANRLGDGRVVYLGEGNTWAERIEDPVVRVADNEADAAVLEKDGFAAEARQEVVGAELIGVERRDGVVVPVRFREVIRAAGPTVRTDLGKQAGN
ncbi:MAG: DUF2849 domain-containing protein [Myxococcota bacterium]